jgi:hypothetical protein
MQLTKQQKEEIIIELASWLPPKKISKEFGIPQGSIYYYCNKHQIPKYQENMAFQKEEYKYEWQICRFRLFTFREWYLYS